jgi:hypothetical protein
VDQTSCQCSLHDTFLVPISMFNVAWSLRILEFDADQEKHIGENLRPVTVSSGMLAVTPRLGKHGQKSSTMDRQMSASLVNHVLDVAFRTGWS